MSDSALDLEGLEQRRDVPGLVAALADSKAILHAIEALGRVRAVDALIAACEHPDVAARMLAARVLGEIGDPGALDALAGLVDQAAPRAAAIEALGKLGAVAIPTLAALTQHEKPVISVRAAVALKNAYLVAAEHPPPSTPTGTSSADRSDPAPRKPWWMFWK